MIFFVSPLYKGGLRGVVTVRVSDTCVYTVEVFGGRRDPNWNKKLGGTTVT
jgi:hypothetical protein